MVDPPGVDVRADPGRLDEVADLFGQFGEAGRGVLLEQRRVKAEWLSARLGQLSQPDRDTLARAAEILDRLARD